MEGGDLFHPRELPSAKPRERGGHHPCPERVPNDADSSRKAPTGPISQCSAPAGGTATGNSTATCTAGANAPGWAAKGPVGGSPGTLAGSGPKPVRCG
jgi:hypothetical protein